MLVSFRELFQDGEGGPAEGPSPFPQIDGRFPLAALLREACKPRHGFPAAFRVLQCSPPEILGPPAVPPGGPEIAGQQQFLSLVSLARHEPSHVGLQGGQGEDVKPVVEEDALQGGSVAG